MSKCSGGLVNSDRPMRLIKFKLKAKISYIALEKITTEIIADNLVEAK